MGGGFAAIKLLTCKGSLTSIYAIIKHVKRRSVSVSLV